MKAEKKTRKRIIWIVAEERPRSQRQNFLWLMSKIRRMNEIDQRQGILTNTHLSFLSNDVLKEVEEEREAHESPATEIHIIITKKLLQLNDFYFSANDDVVVVVAV
ncbi:CLUMA_CG019333, isoform A [Clunio marinus]|uniref:CLUMA_CG019333, isoform A n=1 Tax=Clunio marinus TaxID=568069 RepID=A0A1J1J4E6_9DIPT|nr:CLUMA_CG019333, isoform A [Clunio marinus]